MTPFQERLKNAPNPQLPVPSILQILLFLVLLGWVWVAPIISGVFVTFLPPLEPAVETTISVLLLAVCLLPPVIGYAVLVRVKGWQNVRPFALALLVMVAYIIVAAVIRAIAGSDRSLETILNLTALTTATLLIGGVGLLQAGVPGWMLSHAFGFDRPPLAGLLLMLAFAAIVTVGWPLTGALGDSWTSQMILLHALALSLPEEILFRGAVLGIITFNFQHKKPFAALIALFAYLAFTSSGVIPRQDWLQLFFIIAAFPLALLVIELRALTGSIWAGILFASLFRAAPTLFTDPRVELPLITQPWQTGAHLWLILATGGVALLSWVGRSFLAPRWTLSGAATTGLALGVALALWLGWLGLWVGLGRPGFHNDGFLIVMTEQADLQEAAAIAESIARRDFVRTRLLETAERTQAPVRAALDEAGFSYRPFYLINMIQVEGHHRRMAEFADLPGVDRVLLNPNVRPYPFNFTIGYGDAPDEGQGVGWNISQVRADEVWALGVAGQGVVVGGQDTGYDWQHPALDQAYRGHNQGQIDHTYNWYDAWSESDIPFDDDNHGTHTMGTVLGDDGQNNQIGMAPEAQWIGCRNMRRGLGNPASYTACMEFFLAPYPVNGDPFRDGDVSFAPHIVNNSWGCPDFEGCDDDVLEPAAEALRAAGIMMVVSAGNDGPGCQTVNEPPARYDEVFSVGATNRNGRITGFSSRGPVPNTSDVLKPDIAAPGSSIRSSLAGGGYGVADGTSMAGPHVAGLAALIWSANPELIGQIEATEQIIRQSAQAVEVDTACSLTPPIPDDPTLPEQMLALSAPNVCACGDVTGAPNNVYGWGEIDALRAVTLAMEWQGEND